MYSCDRCGKIIACKKHDPVFITRLGRMHDKCMTRAWEEIEKNKHLRRSEAQKARRQRELGTTSVTPTVSPSQETK
jgi:hypothetical protein